MRFAVTEREKTVTLIGLSGLHAYTHIFQLALVPLYFQIKSDFKLENVAMATLLATIQGLVYYACSVPIGVLADRWSRKHLLTFGLVLNSLGFLGLAHAPTYLWAVVWLAVAGVGGSFYHPAATAMVVQLYPDRPGWALGRAAIGAALGFCFAPWYVGFRAQNSGWRAPCFELGILGILGAIAFAMTAREATPVTEVHHHETHRLKAGGVIAVFVIVALALGLRDFAGASIATITSLFLQSAQGFGERGTGLVIGVMFLAGMAANPILGARSDGNRFGWARRVVIIAAMAAAIVPWVPRSIIWIALAVYGFCMLASYPIIEAALMESVPDRVRGRVFGVFVTVCGLIGSTGPWVMGHISDLLDERKTSVSAYGPIYLSLAGLILASLIGLPLLKWAMRYATRHPAQEAGL
ncbi:MAG: MFS transporter [Verrucomicrobiae bacterium]|nr:MFS transporter [Verrucomicrobiae bacterium]